MKISIFLLIVAVFCVQQLSEAQSKSKLYYSKHWELTTQDSAYYYRVCALDTVKNKFIGEVTDYLINNNQLVMTGSYRNGQKNGEFTLYYPGGQIESQGKFKDGKRFETWKYYYPNGKSHMEVSFTGDEFFVNVLYDNNDKTVITNGNGEWRHEYEWLNVPFKFIVTGPFVNGKKEGEWSCSSSKGDLIYVEAFKKNKFQKGSLFSNGEKREYYEEFPNKFPTPFKFETTETFVHLNFVKRTDYPFFKFLPQPEEAFFDGGLAVFYEFVGKIIKYPAEAKRRSIQGKVSVEFFINPDGSLSDVRAIKGIGGGCDEEAVRVVALSKGWISGKQSGIPVKTKFIIPISFRLQ